MAVAGIRTTTALPCVKEKKAAGNIGSREHTRAAYMPFCLALGGAGAAAKFTFYDETDGYHARLAVQVPQVIHRQDR